MQKKLLYTAGILLIIVVVIIVGVLNIDDCCTATDIRNYMSGFGGFAPVIYIIIFTLVPLTLFPDSVIAIAGGMYFGLFWGFVYTMIGALLGATLSFYIARSVSFKMLKFTSKLSNEALSRTIEKKGFFFILLLRLIPLLPFDVISYGAGLSKVKYKDFIVATLLGIIPGVFVFTNVGDKSNNLGSTSFYVAISMIVLMFVVANYFKKKIKLNEETPVKVQKKDIV